MKCRTEVVFECRKLSKEIEVLEQIEQQKKQPKTDEEADQLEG